MANIDGFSYPRVPREACIVEPELPMDVPISWVTKVFEIYHENPEHKRDQGFFNHIYMQVVATKLYESEVWK